MGDSSVEVRPADGSDFVRLLDIYNSSRAAVGCYSEEVPDKKRFAAPVNGAEIHIAISDGTIVGFVSVWAADCFIHHLYVEPQHQGRGIGSALLRTCESIYGSPLSLNCDTCNEGARRVYRRKGWRPGEKGVGPDGPWERLEWQRA